MEVLYQISSAHESEQPMPQSPTSCPDPLDCLRRVQAALNAHDLEALADCFEPEYRSQFPAHPERAFSGHGPLRANWSRIFGGVPDLRAEMLTLAVDGETVCAEWSWNGTGSDGEPYAMRGVSVQGVRAGRISWVRMYMEPVQAGGHTLPGTLPGGPT
jgi:ketosteroid isomerase-like protein